MRERERESERQRERACARARERPFVFTLCSRTNRRGQSLWVRVSWLRVRRKHTQEEEEEEDLFVFNDTIEGPRAPAGARYAMLPYYADF